MSRRAAPRLVLVLFIACLVGAALGASSASAAFGIKSFDTQVTRDPSGAPDAQAGSHPYAVTASILFNSRENPETGIEEPEGDVKDASVEVPTGLIGNPAATPQCTQEQFQNSANRLPDGCAPDTQVGTATITALNGSGTFAIFNLAPHPGAPAELGFVVVLDPVHAYATIRTGGDYGLDINLRDISQALGITRASLTFWGNPSDPRHDTERSCVTETESSCSSGGTSGPFLTLPTSCAGPQEWRLSATSWQEPLGPPVTATFLNSDRAGTPYGFDGCEQVPFAPGLATSLETPVADSPTGLSVDVSVPQSGEPGAIASANLKAATVTLPPGISIDPSTANGLIGCSQEGVGLTDGLPASCPENSKIGSAEIDTPLLSTPLIGSVFLARQTDNPFGSLIAIYVVAEAQGVLIKVPGKIALDQTSGQLVATFENTPQLPFSDFKLNFFGGPRAALATPVTCGTQTVGASLAPWSGAAAVSTTASVTVNSAAGGLGCPSSASARPFDLSLAAGTVSAAAAQHSPFVFKLSRADGQQEIGAVETTFPSGLLATIRGVPTCAEAQAAAGTCGASSQVGTVSVGAGAGASPFYVADGTAYLTGPYKGAPLGLDFLVPAVAGPLDLGVVNVRAAVFVDPATARVTIKTDPIPQILDGIPLRLRSLQLNVDRPDFVVNPSSCALEELNAEATSVYGASDPLTATFQASDCAGLAFRPKLQTRLIGPAKKLRRAGHPALQVTVTQRPGQANFREVAVALPPAINLDQGNIRTVCTRVQFAAHKCPKGSIYGHAVAITPLLDKPLRGPVILRSSSNKLPDLVADLKGQFEIELAGKIDTKDGGIRATFSNIPDAAISKFILRMNGGGKGLLVNREDLCPRRRHADALVTGQNGRTADQNPRLRYGCRRARSR